MTFLQNNNELPELKIRKLWTKKVFQGETDSTIITVLCARGASNEYF